MDAVAVLCSPGQSKAADEAALEGARGELEPDGRGAGDRALGVARLSSSEQPMPRLPLTLPTS